MPMSSVTHFEIYGEEPSRLADFYCTVFGLQTEKAPGVDYWQIRTDPSKANWFDGGLTFRAIPQSHRWASYADVDAPDDVIAAVLSGGGELLRPKTAISKTGWCAVLPGGNVFGVVFDGLSRMTPSDCRWRKAMMKFLPLKLCFLLAAVPAIAETPVQRCQGDLPVVIKCLNDRVAKLESEAVRPSSQVRLKVPTLDRCLHWDRTGAVSWQMCDKTDRAEEFIRIDAVKQP